MKSRFSQLWYRVEALRPRLRTHVDIRRHTYRGQIWYVILDSASGRVHRFTYNAYAFIGLMDGVQTVQELWDKASMRLGEYGPTQDEVINLLGQLHSADLLQCDVPPDTIELFRRSQKITQTERKQTWLNPLAVKFSIFDPDRFLDRLNPVTRPLFGVFGFLCWLAIVLTGIFFAAQYWGELTNNVTDRVLTPQNLVLVWILFPFIKLFHELGHGLAAKAWGAEVHDCGIMLLVFTPVPYIDVSTTAAFERSWRRIVIAGGGMIFEVLLAVIALAVWINVEPGFVRNCAYNVMFVAGVSTILFNANPLIRFDGYYILSDWIQIPNLAQRARTYVQYLLERYVFGIEGIEPLTETLPERIWFLLYAPASWVYRLSIICGIGLFLAKKFLVIGLLITSWSVLSMLVIPSFKAVGYLFGSPRLRTKRARALSLSIAALALIVAGIAALPLPLRTVEEGVVWLPEDSFVRPGTNAFVTELALASGRSVKPGDVVVIGEDPTIMAEERVIQARIVELEAQYRAKERSDRVEASILREQLSQERARLQRSQERRRDLIIRAQASGVLVVPQPEDMPGKFIKQGETTGYIFPSSNVIVRAVVQQEYAALVRHHTRKVEARFARDFDRIYPVTMVREVPAASEYLPSKTLSVEGGGTTAVDPRNRSGTKTLTRTFQYDLQLPLSWSSVCVGDRVYLRFDHGWEPVMYRWWRAIRQLFMSRLDV